VRVAVEDTGIGIAPENLARLFVAFQQLDAGAAKQFAGTGLGLALTKRIVEAQGGRVEVRSVVGQGSTFSAVLPTGSAQTAAEAPAPSVPRRARRRARPADGAVLVVDDDPSTLKLASAAIAELGFKVITASTAAAALDAAAEPLLAVVLDIVLPDLSGFELLARLRELPASRDATVIAWTVRDINAADRSRLLGSRAVLVPKGDGGARGLVDALRNELERHDDASSEGGR
jgi:CheY-like chemotaxis protein